MTLTQWTPAHLRHEHHDQAARAPLRVVATLTSASRSQRLTSSRSTSFLSADRCMCPREGAELGDGGHAQRDSLTHVGRGARLLAMRIPMVT